MKSFGEGREGGGRREGKNWRGLEPGDEVQSHEHAR